MYRPAINWKFPNIFSCRPSDFCWALFSELESVVASFKEADLFRLLVVISKEDNLLEAVAAAFVFDELETDDCAAPMDAVDSEDV